MTTVRDIYNFIDEVAPFKNQEDYDNSGLCIGWMDDEVTNVLIALDATSDVVRDAEMLGAQLLITHHPVIFKSLKQINFKTVAGRLSYDGMNVISAHTNFDSAKLNDILCDRLGFTPTEVLTEENGVPIGYICDCASQTPEMLVRNVKNVLGTTCIRYNDMGGEITRVAVCSGSGGSLLNEVIDKKADCFITGDVKHDVFISGYNQGITIIDAGHFHTENIFCEYIKEVLEENFEDVDFQIAPSDKDILTYHF